MKSHIVHPNTAFAFAVTLEAKKDHISSQTGEMTLNFNEQQLIALSDHLNSLRADVVMARQQVAKTIAEMPA